MWLTDVYSKYYTDDDDDDGGGGGGGGGVAIVCRPGLGVTVDMDALYEFESYATAAFRALNGGPPVEPSLLTWGSTQGHILSGGGRIEECMVPGRDYDARDNVRAHVHAFRTADSVDPLPPRFRLPSLV